MPIYRISNNYSKTLGGLWKYYRDELALANGGIDNFPTANNNSASSNLKQKIICKTRIDSTKDVEITMSLKYLSNFLGTLEMPLTNCEINLVLVLSDKCVLCNAAAQATTFAITNAKYYVPVVTLSIQDNAKLLQILKSCFKRTVNQNQYQSEVTIQAPNPYLDYLIDPSFERANRLFVLSLENNTDITVHTKYYLPTVEIKDYNVMLFVKYLKIYI